MTLQVDEIAAVTTQHIVKTLPDALAKENYAAKLFFDENKEYVSGGTNIQVPIKLIANAGQGFISGGASAINVNPSQQFQYMTFNWKFHYSNVSFTLEEFTKVLDAPENKVNFIKGKKDGALSDAIRDLTSGLHGSATSNPLSFNGLADMVAASGTAYGGLLNTDYSDATAYLPVISTSQVAPSYNVLSPGISAIRQRAQQMGSASKYTVDTGFASQAVLDAYMRSEQNKQRFSAVKIEKLESGFLGINVNGVNLYMDGFTSGSADGSTADNYLYIFPKSIMKFYYKYGLGKASPFDGSKAIPNQPVQTNQVYLAGNSVCENRRLIAVWKNLIA